MAVKKKASVRKVAKKKPSTDVIETISLTTSSKKLKLDIIEDGVEKGEIVDSLFGLHRTILTAQGEALDDDKEDYIPFLVKGIASKYGLAVTEETAYMIAVEVFSRFGEEKKSSSG